MRASDLIPVSDLHEAYTPEQVAADPSLLEYDDYDPIKDFTKLHALAAYMYAHGNAVSTVSSVTGYTMNSLALWVKSSRNFNRCVKEFQDDPTAKPQYNPVATANTVLGEALDELLRRMANEPDSFTNKELLYLIQMLSDRTDLGLNPKAAVGEEKAVDVDRIKETSHVETGQTTKLPALEEALERARNSRGLDKPQGRVEILDAEEE